MPSISRYRLQLSLFLIALCLTGALGILGPMQWSSGQAQLSTPSLDQEFPASPTPSPDPAPTLDPAMPLEMGPDPLDALRSSERFIPFSRAWGQIQQLGNIHYADILLDGHPLIQVAANVPEPEADASVLPIEIRVERIQNALRRVIQTGFDPERMQILTGTLNNQTVLLASESADGPQQFLLTVTDLDAQLARMEVKDLAPIWGERIEQGLIQAWQERQPDYLWQQSLSGGQILLVTLAISLAITLVQRRLKSRWLNLMRSEDSEPDPAEDSDHCVENLRFTEDLPAGDQEDPAPVPGECTEASRAKTAAMRQTQPFLTGFSLSHPAVNVLLRRILVWVQILLWLGATIWVLYLFPHTRELSNDLLGIPIRILGIWLVLSLSNRTIDILIDQGVRAWVEENTLVSQGSQRYLQRAPTLAGALKGLTDVLVIPIGLIWILYEVQVPIASALTGAGVVGLIVTFSAQNLIKDLVNGFLILFEDQYALGDWVRIDGELGLVEYLDIRITKIRTPNGGLITFPNGTLSKVENLSSDWARVNFEIDIAYDCDVDKAMQIMLQVAEDLYQDREWHNRILEPPQVLGIDRLAHHGVQVRLWIKTQRMEHWGVSREYSRRLKQAFQTHEILIGVPQESIVVRTQPSSSTSPWDRGLTEDGSRLLG